LKNEIRILSVLGLLVALVASLDATGTVFARTAPESLYEVLSPWAEVDAASLRGISPRLDSLAGKKIGIFAKYSLVLGESEEESPWEPLHVERGFKREDNTLTLFFPNGYMQSVPRDTSAEGIAQSLANMGPWNMSCLIVIPSHAKILAEGGWTKKKLKEFILKNTKSPFAAKPKSADVLSQPPQVDTNGPLIVVAGGPGAWMGMFRSVGGIENDFVTTKIDLPKNWDKLVEKYKNVIPTYAGY
jgi:hypothetical protein